MLKNFMLIIRTHNRQFRMDLRRMELIRLLKRLIG